MDENEDTLNTLPGLGAPSKKASEPPAKADEDGNVIQLPEIVVTAKRMTEAEQAEFDRKEAEKNKPKDPEFLSDYDQSKGLFQKDSKGNWKLVLPEGDGIIGNTARFGTGVALETIEGLGTLAGAASDYLFGTKFEDWISRNIPDVVPESEIDRFGMKVVPLFLGFGAGSKIAKKGIDAAKGTDTAKDAAEFIAEGGKVLGRLYERSPGWAKVIADTVKKPAEWLGSKTSGKAAENFATTGVGGTLGATAVMDAKDEDGLIVTREMLGLEDSEYKQLSGRITVLVDGLALSGILSTAADVAKYGYATVGGLLGPGMAVLRDKTMQSEAMKAILLKLEKVSPDSTKEEIAAAANEISELIKANKTEFLRFGDDVLKTLDLDTPTAVAKGTKNQATANNAMDLKRSLADEPAMRSRLSGQQATISEAGEAAVERVGGQEAKVAAGREFASAGMEDVGAATSQAQTARMTVENAEAALQNAEQSVQRLIDQDPFLGETLRRARQQYGSPIGQTAGNRAVEGIRSDIAVVYDGMRTRVNTLANQIPDGVQIDTGGLRTALQDALATLNAFDNAPATQGITRTLLNAFQPRQVAEKVMKEGKEVDQFREETVEEILARIDESGVDFKTLYNSVRPKLSEMISTLLDPANRTVAGVEAAAKLRALRTHIEEDQLEFIIKNGDDEAVETAQEMMRVYKQDFAPLFRDQDVLQNFADLADSTVRRGVSQAGFDARAFDMIKGALDNPGGARRGQIQSAIARLNEIDPNAIPTEVGQYYVGSLLGNLDTMLFGGADRVDPAAIYSTVSRYADALRSSNPQLVESLTGLAQRLQAAKDDVAQLKILANEAKTLANQAKSDATKSAFGKFLLESGEDVIGVAQPQEINQAFQKLFTDKNVSAHMPKLFERARASGNPLVEDGIYSAYLEWATKSLKTTRTVGADSAGNQTRELSQAAAVRASEAFANQDALIREALVTSGGEKGKIISEFMEEMYRQTDLVVGTTGKRSQVRGSTTNYDMALRQSIGRVVTFTLGVLNPLATKARNLGTAVANKFGAEEKFREVIDRMAADPDLFIDTARRYNNALNATDRVAVLSYFALRSGLMAYETPDEALMAAQQMEMMIRNNMPGSETPDFLRE